LTNELISGEASILSRGRSRAATDDHYHDHDKGLAEDPSCRVGNVAITRNMQTHRDPDININVMYPQLGSRRSLREIKLGRRIAY
jgi:hypothetical protein